jgi:DNA-binding MarR family transcriptional regulator
MVRHVGLDWERLAREAMNETQVAILEALASGGGRTPADLAGDLDMALQNVAYHLCKLRDHGLIEVDRAEGPRVGRGHVYQLAHAVRG